MVNKDCFLQGMPCHKYILANLETQDDANVFLKDYVHTMLHVGFSEREIEESFLELTARANARFDFTTWAYDVPGMSRVESIQFCEDVSCHKHCYQLYKEYDKSGAACNTCPLANTYKNAHIDEESLLVNYALSGKKALDYILNKGIDETVFVSQIDIMSSFNVKRGYAYPYFKNSFMALKSQDLSLSKEELADKIKAYHIEKIRRLKLPIASMKADTIAKISLVLYLTYFSNIETDISALDVDRACSTLLKRDRYVAPHGYTNIADGTTLNECFLVSSNKIESADKSASINPKPIASDIDREFPDNRDLVYLEESPKPSITNLFDDFFLGQPMINEEVHGEGNSFSSGSSPILDSEKDHSFPDKESASGLNVRLENEVMPSGVISGYYLTDNDEPSIVYNETPQDNFWYYMPKDIFGIPYISKEELLHFTYSLAIEKNRHIFLTQVRREKIVSVEVVCIDLTHELYLLFYSPKCRAYFSTSLQDVSILNTYLSAILKKPSIIKLCYAPYVLVASLWAHNIYVKGLESLLCIGGLVFPGHSFDPSLCMSLLGAKRGVANVNFKSASSTDESIRDTRCFALAYMCQYPKTHMILKRKISKSGMLNLYEKKNHFANTVGLFYFSNLTQSDFSVLFGMNKCGTYVFQETHTSSYRYEGVYYRYEFLGIPKHCKDFPMELLLCLEEKGKLKTPGINVLGISEKHIEFFFCKEDEGRLKEIVHVALLSLLEIDALKTIQYKLSCYQDK